VFFRIRLASIPVVSSPSSFLSCFLSRSAAASRSATACTDATKTAYSSRFSMGSSLRRKRPPRLSTAEMTAFAIRVFSPSVVLALSYSSALSEMRARNATLPGWWVDALPLPSKTSCTPTRSVTRSSVLLLLRLAMPVLVAFSFYGVLSAGSAVLSGVLRQWQWQ